MMEALKNHGLLPDNALNASGLLPTPIVATATYMTRSGHTYPMLSGIYGGCLHPQFVEWVMGFPMGWSDLDGDDL